jgi:hypothetical protein
MPYTFTNPIGQIITLTIERDDTPAGEELELMTDADQNDVIAAVAHVLFPEDAYETTEENNASSLFQLLCQATRYYSQTAYEPREGNQTIIQNASVQTTLDAIGENLIEEVHA